MLSGDSSGVGPVDQSQITDHPIDRAEELIEELQIESLKNRSIGKMSTGQQRRFLLAQALVNDPEVLVLDTRSTFRYLKTIRKLVQQGKTIVQVTQPIDEIPPEIDRIVLLDQGRIVAAGANRRSSDRTKTEPVIWSRDQGRL